jgi:acetyl-CoA carboxylase biotin carboxylase subunit
LIEGGRHVEIQIFADRYGNAIHVGERDCTVQRNHQKLIEESPSPVLPDAVRQATLATAVGAAAAIGYVGAGTIEMLLESGLEGRPVLRFMEMNTRLQVEHSVSEERSGLDLVVLQLRTAAGHRLPIAQADVRLDGHVIECRINAEDPDAGFRPVPGTITAWRLPDRQDGAIRVDTHVAPGYVVPPHYDSLLCKVIARGADRADAIARMVRALGELTCEGVSTTVSAHQRILASAAFRDHAYDTRTIPGLS